MIFLSVSRLPKDRELQIFFLGLGSNSQDIEGIPFNSFHNRCPTTVICFFIQLSGVLATSSAVLKPCPCRKAAYCLPMPHISPTSVTASISFTFSWLFAQCTPTSLFCLLTKRFAIFARVFVLATPTHTGNPRC